jgi:hypothetical protein
MTGDVRAREQRAARALKCPTEPDSRGMVRMATPIVSDELWSLVVPLLPLHALASARACVTWR